MAKLGAPDTENTSKQQSNDTQGAAMHSGVLSKKDLLIIYDITSHILVFAEE